MRKTIRCYVCGKELYIPLHGDREDVMRPHLSNCPPPRDEDLLAALEKLWRQGRKQ